MKERERERGDCKLEEAEAGKRFFFFLFSFFYPLSVVILFFLSLLLLLFPRSNHARPSSRDEQLPESVLRLFFFFL